MKRKALIAVLCMVMSVSIMNTGCSGNTSKKEEKHTTETNNKSNKDTEKKSDKKSSEKTETDAKKNVKYEYGMTNLNSVEYVKDPSIPEVGEDGNSMNVPKDILGYYTNGNVGYDFRKIDGNFLVGDKIEFGYRTQSVSVNIMDVTTKGVTINFFADMDESKDILLTKDGFTIENTDEIEKSMLEWMTQTLYSLSSGTEKRRLSGGMEVNESSRFRTALFLTSEKSILAQCNMNTGLLTRNFEFQNVTWTSSAESADRIKSVVTENYGHVIPRVAKWLLAQDRQELVEKIVQETNAVIKRAREAKTYNNLTERTAKQSALILVAVDIVNEVLKLKLNKEAIGDFMEEHSLVNSVEQVSIGKRAMEWLLQFISKNYTQFLSKDSPKEISNCRGKLENMQTVLLNTDEESGMRLKVTDSEFMKILKEGHFSEKATVLKEWKEMGYLKAQSDRYISRIKIVGDIQVKGYIIQLPVPSNKISGAGVKDYEEVLEERRKRINKPRQVIKDEYVEDDFFSIDDDDDLDFPEDWK